MEGNRLCYNERGNIQNSENILVMEEIEECDEMNKLIEDFTELQELQNSINILISQQRFRLDSITENVSSSECNMEEAVEELEKAHSYFFKYTPVIFGTTIGVIATGPLGGMVGIKLGSIITSIGGVFGGWVGYKMQK